MSGSTLGMTKNYNSSSVVQLSAVQISIPFIKQAIDALDVTSSPSSPFIIADYGSSHGLSSLYAMKTIIAYVQETKKDMREPLVIHNDLPTNDWTTLFQLLIADDSYKGIASGRSFYKQCLPSNSLSIGYSSSSIHWLSGKPCNISDHCYADLSGNAKDREAFKHQAYLDYCQFLEYRSRELLPSGVLLLAIFSANDHINCVFELLYECAQSLPMTPEELLDYTIPFYVRSYEECVDMELFARCSMKLIKSEFVPLEIPLFKQWQDGQLTLDEFAHSATSLVRGWSESILQQTLIKNDRVKEDIPQLLNRFWTSHEEEVKKRTYVYQKCVNYTYVILKKVA